MPATLEFTPVGDYLDILDKHFSIVYPKGFIRCQGTLLPSSFAKFADDILNLDIRDDDVWVCSFPKTGTTWTQEMVWCISNDLDFEGAKVQQEERFPFLDLQYLVSDALPDQPENSVPQSDMKEIPRYVKNSIGYIKDAKSPRFIKTHLPFYLLPLQLQRGQTSAKIVYVNRNCKDTCISYFHHGYLLESFTGTFDDFATLFINDSVVNAPFWKNVLSYWERRNSHNMLLLKFEDMKKDLPSVIRKTAEFLGKEIDDQQVELLSDHLSFEKMKNNPAVNFEEHVRMSKSIGPPGRQGEFMRSGKVGEWKTRLSPEWIRRFDQWTEENLRGTDLTF